ncbi:hypothetical protein OUM_0198 [Helicobacter pylori R038b]|uniref:Uncharacterized protein n=1 Tax=Helicobacter pylori R038b TaxID=1145115 RepID=K2LE41_HELPX|nr:hypothetical protein OUM_0198 [Helicobacter pylori R038b]
MHPLLKSLEYKLAQTKALSCYHYYIFVLRNLMIIFKGVLCDISSFSKS